MVDEISYVNINFINELYIKFYSDKKFLKKQDDILEDKRQSNC